MEDLVNLSINADTFHSMSKPELDDMLREIEATLELDIPDTPDKPLRILSKVIASGAKVDWTNKLVNDFRKVYDLMNLTLLRARELDEIGENVLDQEYEDMSGRTMTFRDRWSRDFAMWHYLEQTARSWIMFRSCDVSGRATQPGEDDVWIMDPYDKKNLDGCNEYQKAHLMVLKVIWECQYKRYGDKVCSQIKSADGYDTRAWEVRSDIKDFVYSIVQKEVNPDLWLKATRHGGMVNDIAKLLENARDLQFPDIVKDRRVWSFANGLFMGKVETGDPKAPYKTAFYPYDSNEFRNLPHTVVAAKYFDTDFVDHSKTEDWFDIPTPHMQSIMDYQGYTADASRWVYVMAGRLCFELGELDRWQVIPFFKGIAKSGKSTLLTKVFKKFYTSEDVKVMSNNIEKKFGLGVIHDSFLFIAPEVKYDFALDQAEFQSIVTGEDVSVAVKFGNAKTVNWQIPGVLAGNEIPNWKDNSGSIMRRIFPFDFMKQVREADGDLEFKLEDELPAIIEKCVRAYVEETNKNGKRDIWKIVPDVYRKAQSQMAAATNVLCEFITSENVRLDPNAAIPFSEFRDQFYEYCDANNTRKPARFTAGSKEAWIGPFSQYDIAVETSAKKEIVYNGKVYKGKPIIYGLDVVIDDQMQQL